MKHFKHIKVRNRGHSQRNAEFSTSATLTFDCASFIEEKKQ